MLAAIWRLSCYLLVLYMECESGGIGRRTRLRIWRGNPWGFESPLSHQYFLRVTLQLCSVVFRGVTLRDMNTPNQPNVKFVQTPDYRETYSNSVQIRVNVWDFFLVFGTMQQSSETQVELRNFQGIYLSPQQAKALMAHLQQNVSNYEVAFGEIKLDPRAPGGPVH